MEHDASVCIKHRLGELQAERRRLIGKNLTLDYLRAVVNPGRRWVMLTVVADRAIDV